MAKNNSKKKNTKKQISGWKLVLLIAAAVFIYFYTNNPAFKNKVDTAVNQAIEKVESFLGIEPVPEPQQAEASVQTPAPANGMISLTEQLAFPVCAGANHAKDHERRDYKHYSICYREAYEQAEWSAYCLEESELVKNAGRSDDFRPDPAITTGSATLSDYKGSGYDRGHLSPAADFAFDKEAMSETFYMSNMSPQAGPFNRGIWKDLESSVRDWAKKFGRVYVISGPVLDEPASAYETIGANKVSIPKYYYKVLMAPLYENEADRATPEDVKKITAIAFIFPNTKLTDSFFNYAVTIDEVEKRTGLDFFAGLDDTTENAIEAVYDIALWK